MASRDHRNRLEEEIALQNRELKKSEEANKQFVSLESYQQKLSELQGSWISSKIFSYCGIPNMTNIFNWMLCNVIIIEQEMCSWLTRMSLGQFTV